MDQSKMPGDIRIYFILNTLFFHFFVVLFLISPFLMSLSFVLFFFKQWARIVATRDEAALWSRVMVSQIYGT